LGSELLEDKLVELCLSGTLDADVAKQELQKAFIDTDAVLRANLPVDDRSGTTVVCATITQNDEDEYCVQLAHSGDSRAVLSVGQELKRTDDHKPTRPDETARIHAAGGSVECGQLGGPMRVDGALAVSRALGDFHFKPFNMKPELCKVTALPDVQTISGCRAGDWLLLACDGVFDVFTNEEAHEFVASRLASGSDTDGGLVLTQLLEMSLTKGSKDNCTAILVEFGPQVRQPLTRELIPGDADRAVPEVREKYIQFMQAEGFKAEAADLRALPHVSTRGDTQPVQGQGNLMRRAQTTALEPPPKSSCLVSLGQMCCGAPKSKRQ